MAVPVDPRNVFTVDLEEWFHVCGVGGPLAPDNWDRLPVARGSRPRGCCSTCSIAPASAPRSSSSAGSRERYPVLIERCGGGPRHRVAWLPSRPCLRPRSRRVPRRSSRERRRAGGGRRSARDAVSRAGMVDQRPVALGACRRSWKKAFTLDASMAPLRIVGDVTISAPSSSCGRRPPGRSTRSAAARRRSVRPGHADGLGLGSSDELARARASRDRCREPRGRPRRAHGPPMGARSRTSAREPAREAALRALLPAQRLSRTPARHPARSSVRPHRRRWREYRHDVVTIKAILVISSLAALSLVVRRGRVGVGSADARLHGSRSTTSRPVQPRGCWTRRARCLRSPFRSLCASSFRVRQEIRRLSPVSPPSTSAACRSGCRCRRRPRRKTSSPGESRCVALLEKQGSALTIFEVAVDRQPVRLARFAAEVAATEVRASHDDDPPCPWRSRHERSRPAGRTLLGVTLHRTSTFWRFPTDVSRSPAGCNRSIRSRASCSRRRHRTRRTPIRPASSTELCAISAPRW